MSYKKIKIVTVFLLALLAGGLLLWAISKPSLDNVVTINKDPDTGETVYTDSARTTETKSKKDLPILGGELLYRAMAPNQFTILRVELSNYFKSAIPKATVIKVLPPSVSINNTDKTIKASIKTDASDKIYEGFFALHKAQFIKIKLTDPSSPSKPVIDTPALEAPSYQE